MEAIRCNHLYVASIVHSHSTPAASKSNKVEKPPLSYSMPRRSASSVVMTSPTYLTKEPISAYQVPSEVHQRSIRGPSEVNQPH